MPLVQVAGEAPDSTCPPWLHWTVRRHAGRVYLFVVNNGDGEGRFTVTWPDGPQHVVALDEDRSLRLEDGRHSRRAARPTQRMANPLGRECPSVEVIFMRWASIRPGR